MAGNQVAGLRKRYLVQVHLARKALGLTDPEYRGILEAMFGVESSGKLNPHQLARLVERFRELGWVEAELPAKAKRASNFVEIKDTDQDALQKRKILAMWRDLGWDPTKIHGRCKRQFGVDRFEFLHDQGALQTLARDLSKRLASRRRQAEPA